MPENIKNVVIYISDPYREKLQKMLKDRLDVSHVDEAARLVWEMWDGEGRIDIEGPKLAIKCLWILRQLLEGRNLEELRDVKLKIDEPDWGAGEIDPWEGVEISE